MVSKTREREMKLRSRKTDKEKNGRRDEREREKERKRDVESRPPGALRKWSVLILPTTTTSTINRLGDLFFNQDHPYINQGAKEFLTHYSPFSIGERKKEARTNERERNIPVKDRVG